MSNTVIRVENLSKLYRLGEIGTGSLAHDVNRWWHRVRGKEDPYLKIGQVNDRTRAASGRGSQSAVGSGQSATETEDAASPLKLQLSTSTSSEAAPSPPPLQLKLSTSTRSEAASPLSLCQTQSLPKSSNL